MARLKANFVAGLLLGAAVAVLTPFIGADVLAGLSVPAKASVTKVERALPPQVVNRTSKSDRLHPARTSTDSRLKPAKIPEGCDPAFSPLSKGASANFSSRCMV